MSPRRRGPRVPYAEAVPSVWRAVRAVEALGARDEGTSLADLSRSLDVTASSLLAILRTLERAGWVQRDPASRRYRLGAALARIGAASQGGRLMALAQELRRAADHLAAAAGAEPTPSDTARADSDVERELWAGPLAPAELDAFLGGPWLATLACVKEDGYPCTVPVWYEWRAGRFWIIARGRASWADHVQRAGRVALTVSEPSPPFRRVRAEGRLEPIGEPEPSLMLAIHRRMLERYLGPAYSTGAALAPGRLFCVAPERLVAWRGLVSLPGSPHAETSDERPGETTGSQNARRPANRTPSHWSHA